MTTKTVTTDSEAYRRAVDLEPALQAVESMVHALAAGAADDRPFCSSCLWEDILKPLVAPLVGWERGLPHRDAKPPRDTLEPIDFRARMVGAGEFVFGQNAAEPSTPEEAWLRTTEAYDAVTDPLLAILDAVDPGLGHGYPGRVRS